MNKGPQNLYELKMTVSIDGVVCDSVKTKFGIREITSDTNTPDKSRIFYVNGKRLFIRGTNWIPEAMLRTSDERTYAELRYSLQSGVNLYVCGEGELLNLTISSSCVTRWDYWYGRNSG